MFFYIFCFFGLGEFAMRTKRKIIGMDCSNVAFCCGPCSSKVEENPERIFLKPNDGNRYAKFTWTMANNTLLDLRNVRMCRPCCHRYIEMVDGLKDHDAECLEMMHRDAQAIVAKHNLM